MRVDEQIQRSEADPSLTIGPRRVRTRPPGHGAFAPLLLALALISTLAGALTSAPLAQPGPPPFPPGRHFPPPAGSFQPTPDLTTLEELRAEALAAGLSEAQSRSLSDRITRLAAGRLPWRPVLDRTRQGLAKGASFERIDSVCNALEARLRTGAALVDGAFVDAGAPRAEGSEPAPERAHPGPAEARIVLIDHTTFALEQGVESGGITTLFTTLRSSTTPTSASPPTPPASAATAPAGVMLAMTSPVVAVASLTSEGVPSARSVEVVTAAWRNGLRGGQMEELGLGMALALRTGRPPEEVMNRVIEMCRRGVPPEKILGDFPRPRPGFQPPKGRPPGDRPSWLPVRPGQRRGERPPDDPGRRGRPGGGRGGSGGTGGTGGI